MAIFIFRNVYLMHMYQNFSWNYQYNLKKHFLSSEVSFSSCQHEHYYFFSYYIKLYMRKTLVILISILKVVFIFSIISTEVHCIFFILIFFRCQHRKLALARFGVGAFAKLSKPKRLLCLFVFVKALSISPATYISLWFTFDLLANTTQ